MKEMSIQVTEQQSRAVENEKGVSVTKRLVHEQNSLLNMTLLFRLAASNVSLDK